jgi:ABC-type transport system involved in multi-copper enzyme maturation permease subunit
MPRAAFPALSALLAIARLAAIEAIRRPVFLLVSLGVAAGIVLLPLLLNYTLGDSARIVRDSALALYFVGGLFLGAHAAAESLARELRRGTAAAALAKPIPRAHFFLAKAAGVAAALLLYALLALAATLLAVRAGASDLRIDRAAALPALAALLLAPAAAGAWNHRTRRPFASAAFFLLLAFMLAALALSAALPTPGDNLAFPRNFSWNLLGLGFLLYLGIGMFCAAAAALATRLPLAPVLLLVAGLFLYGLVADSLLGPHLADSLPARAAYALAPNVQALWLPDALDAAIPIPPAYYALAAAYAVAWSAAALALGALSFQKLEIP